MDDWLESDTVIEFFRWKPNTVIKNLDYYIVENIREFGSEYIFELLQRWEMIVMEETILTEVYDSIYKYMRTYIRLYVIEDVWDEFYTNFINLLRDVRISNPAYLTSIISLFDYKEICDFCIKIYKRGISKQPSNYTRNAPIVNETSHILFLIKELLLLNHEDIEQVIREFDYEIENPLLKPVGNEITNYNLIHLAYMLPSYGSDTFDEDIKILNTLTRFLLKKKYKRYMLAYFEIICSKFGYRVKDYFNMSIRRNIKVDNFLINFMHIMLKLWNGGRRLHSSRIGDIDTKYLYSDNCLIKEYITEPTICKTSMNTFEDLPERYDFLTECFYLTHRIVYLTMYPLFKVYYKIKYKIIDLERSVRSYIKRYGGYENIPILERSIYNRLKNLSRHYEDERDDIIRILNHKQITDVMPYLCEETITILNKMRMDNLMLYQLFPESILDFCTEYLIFQSSALKKQFTLPIFGEFIIMNMSNKNKITNPYLRYKLFDVISTNSETINFVLSLILCKRTLVENIINLYCEANVISTPMLIRDRINFFMIKALHFSKDYSYSISTIKDKRKLIKYLYLEVSELLSNFDIVIKNLNTIYALRDDPEFSNISTEYNLRLNNSFMYLKTMTTLITNYMSVLNIRVLFEKRELISQFTNFIHYVFKKSTKINDEIDFYNERFKSSFNDIGAKIDHLHKFCFLMYSELSKNPLFMEVVDKSYVFFDKTVMIERLENCLTSGLISWVYHDTVMIVINKVSERIEQMLEEEEVPDEFLDPIMNTPIKDPVILPENDIIMDMNVISTHLLTNKTNPFTRSELTMEILKEYNLREESKKLVNDFKDRYIKWREGREDFYSLSTPNESTS